MFLHFVADDRQYGLIKTTRISIRHSLFCDCCGCVGNRHYLLLVFHFCVNVAERTKVTYLFISFYAFCFSSWPSVHLFVCPAVCSSLALLSWRFTFAYRVMFHTEDHWFKPKAGPLLLCGRKHAISYHICIVNGCSRYWSRHVQTWSRLTESLTVRWRVRCPTIQGQWGIEGTEHNVRKKKRKTDIQTDGRVDREKQRRNRERKKEKEREKKESLLLHSETVCTYTMEFRYVSGLLMEGSIGFSSQRHVTRFPACP